MYNVKIDDTVIRELTLLQVGELQTVLIRRRIKHDVARVAKPLMLYKGCKMDIIARAQRASTGSLEMLYLIVDPDKDQTGRDYTIATETDMQTYYHGQRLDVIAVFSDGSRVD